MKAIAVLLLFAFALIGCGGNLESKIVGSWKADPAKTQMGGDKLKTEADKKLAEAMVKTIALDLKADKSFELTILLPITGTWTLQGNKLVLTPTKKPGETISFAGKETLDFDIDPSGTTMSMKSTDPTMPGTLVLNKESS